MTLQTVFKRREVKYLVSADVRARLEPLLAQHMVADEHGKSTICNVYFDTPLCLLTRRSIEHPQYKEKVRLRSYGTAGQHTPAYLELKKKVDGVVYKRRIQTNAPLAMRFIREGDQRLIGDSQVARELTWTRNYYGDLEPAVYVSYDREAFFAAGDRDFRVTFDQDIRWRSRDVDLTVEPGGEALLPPGMQLMELKCGGAMPLWMAQFLSANGLCCTGFSKVGLAYTRMFERKQTPLCA